MLLKDLLVNVSHSVVCMSYRAKYPSAKWQRWAAVRPQTWQPCPRTTCWWARWTKPQCSQWSERRYRCFLTLSQMWWKNNLFRPGHLFVFLVFQSDHHKRDWGQRVEEEIRGEQSRGHGDEVWVPCCFYLNLASHLKYCTKKHEWLLCCQCDTECIFHSSL